MRFQKTVSRGRSGVSRWRFVLFLAAIAISISMITSVRAMAAGTKTVSMKKAGTNRYACTVRIGRQSTVYFKITIKKAGIVQFTGFSRRGKGAKHGLTGILLKAGKKLKNQTPYYLKKDAYLNSAVYRDAFYAVKKGTYYFRMNTTGLAGYTCHLDAVFTPRKDSTNGSKESSAQLQPGRLIEGMFWFDGIAGIDPNTYFEQRWFHFQVTAGQPVQLWYWSNYHVPDLYFENGQKITASSVLKKWNGRIYTVFTFTPSESGWQYVYIDNPVYEKMYAVMVR